MVQAQHIVVVDDEQPAREMVGDYLRMHGFTVSLCDGGASLRSTIAQQVPDLIVLDLNMPAEDGLSIIRDLKQRSSVPIIMLTATASAIDRVVGLELGADDYLAKPFSPKELVLRVGAILRRLAAPPVAAGGRLVGGPIVLDRTAHRVTADGKEVELTATEFKLLERLIERRDRVQSRSQLLESVWQAQPDIQTRTVDMHVQRLRTKLGAAGDWIETVRAVGYRFREPVVPPKRPTPAPRRKPHIK